MRTYTEEEVHEAVRMAARCMGVQTILPDDQMLDTFQEMLDMALAAEASADAIGGPGTLKRALDDYRALGDFVIGKLA